MDKTQKNTKMIGMKILECTQILYQNKEIDNATKAKITSLLKSAMRDGDFHRLNSLFKNLTYGVTGCLTATLEECIKLTN